MKAKNSRYIIGIDLGTTNCALSYIDTFKDENKVEDFSIKQWAGDNSFVELTSMPSFLYRLKKSEVKHAVAKLSWQTQSPHWAIGYGARKMQEVAEQRVIHSAKSWLCQSSVNRLEKFLPFSSKEIIGEDALSPIEAQSMLLEHLRKAWDEEKSLGGEFSFEKQQVVITVPASFDEVAQKLTLDAAEMAGYPDDISLLEEPLSAFYSIDKSEASLKVDDKILVFDMGGGTTDFSLLSVDSELKLKRDKVSDHILLGGDNIDLLIAKKMEEDAKQKGVRLTPSQWAQLKVQARVFKEKSFLDDEAKNFYVSLASSGSSLFSKAISLEIKAEDVRNMILEGFFLEVSTDEEAKIRPAGLKEFGLSYAYDYRVLAHLNSFLKGETFNKVLFAGGSVQSPKIRSKILRAMNAVEEIKQKDHFLSISRGASSFSLAKRTKRDLVVADYARNVFLELMTNSGEKNYMLVLKKDSRLGLKYELKDLGIEALLNRKASFNLYTSNESLDLSLGAVLSSRLNLHPLSPLSAKLESKTKDQKRIKVELELDVKESGLITIFCINASNKEESWPLYFNINSKNVASEASSLKVTRLNSQFTGSSFDMVDSLYGKSKKKTSDIKANHLVKSLEKIGRASCRERV